MIQRRILLLLLLALIGYAAVAFLFPGTHPAARWKDTLDRSRATELARKEAERQGLDPADSAIQIESVVQRNTEQYLNGDPNPIIAPLLSPIASEITLVGPKIKRFQVSLASGGRVIAWERTAPSSEKPVIIAEDEKKRLAEEALKHLAGSAAPRFNLKSDAGASSNVSQYSWELSLAEEPRVKMAAIFKFENGTITEASLSAVFTREYLASIAARRSIVNAMKFTWPIFIILSVLVGLIYYLLHIIRKEVSPRSVIVLFASLFVLITLWVLNSSLFDDIYVSLAQVPQLQKFYFGAFLAWLAVALVSLLFSFPLALIWGAGYPLATRLPANPLRGLELLIRGHLRTRVVAISILTGLTLGWIVPLSAMLIARIGMFSSSDLRSAEALAEQLTARVPLLTMPTQPVIVSLYLVFFLYVFVVPLASSLLGRPLLVRAIGVIVGATCVSGASFFQSSLPASLVAAAILMLVVDQLTHRAGILTALVALLAGDYAIKVSALLSQSGASLQSTGMRGWLIIAAALIVVAWLALRGRELDATEAEAAWTTEAQRSNRVDRERLKAEFDVARRAQQQMLPENPPAIPGYRIAAVCRPAREVGGDLYDFIVLPDDRLGIVVADVSGKGVPASLYMTLTKGLLASVAEASSDPGEILREVNKHLYVACGKKMFVTLLLGVLDISSRSFSYARAGHNPPVWRQRDGGKTSLLRARGLGLGLNSGEVFNRALAVETIQLAPHDKLFLYSDGITEAMNEGRDEYGEERLMELAGRLDELDAQQTRDAVLKDVSAFLGATPPQDDQTLVIVEVC